MRDALAGWMIGDAGKDVGKPGPRIDLVSAHVSISV
jgi:hypothetical protein